MSNASRTAGSRSVKRTLVLLPEDWDRLEQLAGSLGCLNRRGSAVGRPSVAALMRDLARGTIHARRSGSGEPKPLPTLKDGLEWRKCHQCAADTKAHLDGVPMCLDCFVQKAKRDRKAHRAAGQPAPQAQPARGDYAGQQLEDSFGQTARVNDEVKEEINPAEKG
jgi:hypothetical protein